jgi:hypothetical protein
MMKGSSVTRKFLVPWVHLQLVTAWGHDCPNVYVSISLEYYFITINQPGPSVNYFQAFPDDKRSMKTLVVTIFLMEIAQSCLVLADGFRWFGSHWGDIDELDKIGMTWLSLVIWGPLSMSTFPSLSSLSPMIGFSVALIVQTFYAWRIWILSKRVFFPAIILLVCLVHSMHVLIHTLHCSSLCSSAPLDFGRESGCSKLDRQKMNGIVFFSSLFL